MGARRGHRVGRARGCWLGGLPAEGHGGGGLADLMYWWGGVLLADPRRCLGLAKSGCVLSPCTCLLGQVEAREPLSHGVLRSGGGVLPQVRSGRKGCIQGTGRTGTDRCRSGPHGRGGAVYCVWPWVHCRGICAYRPWRDGGCRRAISRSVQSRGRPFPSHCMSLRCGCGRSEGGRAGVAVRSVTVCGHERTGKMDRRSQGGAFERLVSTHPARHAE